MQLPQLSKRTYYILGGIAFLLFVFQDPIDKHLIGNWYGWLFRGSEY